MSTPVLLGAVGFGALWVAVTSKSSKMTADANAPANGTDGKEITGPGGAVVAANQGGGSIGDVPVTCGDAGGCVIDNTGSPGGADPSTMPSAGNGTKPVSGWMDPIGSPPTSPVGNTGPLPPVHEDINPRPQPTNTGIVPPGMTTSPTKGGTTPLQSPPPTPPIISPGTYSGATVSGMADEPDLYLTAKYGTTKGLTRKQMSAALEQEGPYLGMVW